MFAGTWEENTHLPKRRGEKKISEREERREKDNNNSNNKV
jgi:hypothetical protein